jgi:hypothetical protein
MIDLRDTAIAKLHPQVMDDGSLFTAVELKVNQVGSLLFAFDAGAQHP